MKKLLIALTLIIAVITGCGNGDDNTAVAEVIPPVSNAIESYGTVQISDSQHVAIEIPGRITAVGAKSGQTVSKGDLLFSMDMSEYTNELERKKASLAMLLEEVALMGNPDDDTMTAQEESSQKQLDAGTLEKDTLYSQYSNLKKAIDNGTDEDIQMADIGRNRAETALTVVQEELAKSQEFFDSGIISREELNLAKRSVTDAEAAYTNAKLTYSQTVRLKKQERDTLLQSYRLAESQLSLLTYQQGQTNLQYDAKLLEIKGLEDEINQMEEHLNASYISDKGQVICHLPSGIIDDFHLTVGDYITGDPNLSVYTLHDTETLEIYTEVSEDFIKDIQLGQTAEITPIASRDKVYTGTVTFISGVAYDQGGEAVIPVRVSIDNDDGFLKANYSVDVSFEVDEVTE